MSITCDCERCGRRCQVAGDRNPDARLLRKSAVPKGYCVNCAVTQFLLNTYPCNMLLDENGPGALRVLALQEQFADIMRVGMADAHPDEIDWEAVIANWDLPVKVERSATNPYMPRHPKRAPKREHRPPRPDPLPGVDVITSFDQINQIEPGLGDDLRRVLRGERRPDDPGPPRPAQGELFPGEDI
jgi:hypothetical protein